MSFEALGLEPRLLRALTAAGYDTPTPIQLQAIPHVLAHHDLMASAQTGTGKTASFALPLLQLLAAENVRPAPKSVRALILVPTRELAAQVLQHVERYGAELRFNTAVMFGGVSERPQIAAAARGLDILIATPGRLLDLMSQRAVSLAQVKHLVLDEADRMLDMGFMPALKRILTQLPRQRQTLMFSATFAPEVRSLAQSLLHKPVEVDVSPRNSTAVTVEHLVHSVPDSAKRDALLHVLTATPRQTLVFTRTKHGADKVVRFLESYGMKAAALHGNKSQNARTKALSGFKSGELNVLVATDIASRGIDIKELPAVINFDLPNVPEDYVHRIGRTGRAGAAGLALSLVGREDEGFLRAIERVLRTNIRRETLGNFVLPERVAEEVEKVRGPRPQRSGQAQRGYRGAGAGKSQSQTGTDASGVAKPAHPRQPGANAGRPRAGGRRSGQSQERGRF
jgi:ATP-dependent RNA helicase RhlE